MFKNLYLYRITPEWPTTAEQLNLALAAEPFAPCTATQAKATGWVPPRGEDGGELVENIGGHWIARLAIETKAVPADALRKRVDDAVAHIEQTTGRMPSKKARRDLRDDALQALLPQAFPRRKNVTVWIDPATGVLAIDASTMGAADEVVTSLVRVAGPGFGVRLLQTTQTPQSAMAAWLTAESSYDLPENFFVDRECELKGSGDEPAVVKFTRHDLVTDEIRDHVLQGKLPTKLALGWQGRVGFMLTHTMQIKKIAFHEGVLEKSAGEVDEDRFDADVALTTGELAPLIADLIDALGGEADPADLTQPQPEANPQ